MYIRVRVDLRRVLGARAARRGLVLMRVPAGARAAALPVSWLLGRLRALLAPAPPALRRPLALCVRGHLLPPREALAVLRAGDVVQVYPLGEEDNLSYNYNTDEVLPMDDENLMPNKQRNIWDKVDEDFMDCRSTEIRVQPERDEPDGLLEEEKHHALRLLESLAPPFVASNTTNPSDLPATCGLANSYDSPIVCGPPASCRPPESSVLPPVRRRRRVRRRRARSPAAAPELEPEPVSIPAPISMSPTIHQTPLHIRISDSEEAMAPAGTAAARRGRAVRALDTRQVLETLP